MVDEKSQLHIHKNWRFLTSTREALEAIERKWPRDHPHKRIQGSMSGESAKYPKALGEALCREVMAQTLVAGVAADLPWGDRLVKEIEVLQKLAPAVTFTVEEDPEEKEPSEEMRRDVELKLHRLHTQLGHPAARHSPSS